MSYLNQYFKVVKENKRDSGAIAFYASLDEISKVLPEIASSILQELKDQRNFLKLIASENYCSLSVQLAMGNLLTDKYSEGIAKKRFYAGCDNVDLIESMASDLAKKIFKSDHAYVQPHSGADANMVAFWATIIQRVQIPALEKMGKTLETLTVEEYEQIRQLLVNQKIMGMSIDAGGHLTHGYKHNISSKMMRSVSYGVDPKSGLIDYVELKKSIQKEKPLILMVGYSAYPRLIDFAKMKEIADSVNAVLIVDMAHFAGLVAGGVFKNEFNPVLYADIVTSTTHKTLRGPRGGLILCKESFKDSIDKGCPLVLGGPMPHVMAAKAIAFKEASTKEFSTYAHKIVENAKELAEAFLKLGVKVVTGGTDNHIVLLDVFSSFNLNGRQAENVLRKASFTLNRNMIPKDKNGAWYTSGIRLGTPAITTLNMGKEQMRAIARLITNVLKHTKVQEDSKAEAEIDENILKKTKDEVKEILNHFPLYPELVI